MRRGILRASICAAAAIAATAGLSAPAHATVSSFTPSPFDTACVNVPEPCAGWTTGQVNWSNRTANVTGTVYDFSVGTTTAIFEFYHGATKLGGLSQSRFADDEGSTGPARGFDFTVEYQQPGGIDRVKITVCRDMPVAGGGTLRYCNRAENYSRGLAS